jgi:hypothetical protein
VQWKLTIPHDADVQDSGVRLALYYDSGDSFQCNIMAGGLEGDSGFDVTVDGVTGPRVLSAGPPGATPNQLVSTIITLPANKTCDYCVLQWVWAARSDGGFYVDCADIAITRDGARTPSRTHPPPWAPTVLIPAGVPSPFSAPHSPSLPEAVVLTDPCALVRHVHRTQATRQTMRRCLQKLATNCRSTSPVSTRVAAPPPPMAAPSLRSSSSSSYCACVVASTIFTRRRPTGLRLLQRSTPRPRRHPRQAAAAAVACLRAGRRASIPRRGRPTTPTQRPAKPHGPGRPAAPRHRGQAASVACLRAGRRPSIPRRGRPSTPTRRLAKPSGPGPSVPEPSAHALRKPTSSALRRLGAPRRGGLRGVGVLPHESGVGNAPSSKLVLKVWRLTKLKSKGASREHAHCMIAHHDSARRGHTQLGNVVVNQCRMC